MLKPMVYLVGAGPGDPGLITARGLQVLTAADTVIYDHLASPRLLRSARADAEKIYVGKTATAHAFDQEAINLLLAEKAGEGRSVVRLRGGDLFLYGRGDEEAGFLHQQRIPYEIIPGVTLGVAAAAYAGIPITPRGVTSVVTFVTAPNDAAKEADIDWAGVARAGGTIVCYLGARALLGVVSQLLAHGRARSEPAAVIRGATSAAQDTLTGTLGDLIELADRAGLKAPAVLITGPGVSLRERLRWFDARPLFGRRVVVTRSREQANELVERLESLGAETIEVPTIRILPPEDSAALNAAVASAGTFDWIVFTSANGVEHFMRAVAAGPGDTRDLKGPCLCAIGPATADRLTRLGLKVELMPVEYRAEAVVEALKAGGDLTGKRVLLPRADIARGLLADELRKAGADVHDVKAYRTVLEEGDRDVYGLLLQRRVDVVTFTSSSTVRSFVAMLGAEQAADLLKDVAVASIGPVTAETAAAHKIVTRIMPREYTIPALAEAIVEHFRSS